MLLCSEAMVELAFSKRDVKSGMIVSAAINCFEKESKTSESTHSCSVVIFLVLVAASALRETHEAQQH
jgi:hypothetical protein